MRAVAILGPDVSPASLALFATPACTMIGHERGQPVPPADAALVFGGDGTIHHYLRDLSVLKIPVLIVPLGSGNDFARSLGIRRKQHSLAAWKRFQSGADNVRQIDLGEIRPDAGSSRLFCNVGGAGIDSDANRRANAMPRWLRGRGGYLIAALQAIRASSATRFDLQADQRCLNEPGLLAAFANAPAYGGGLRIAPEADLSDGRLDVCFVRGVGKARLLRLLPRVRSGAHIRLPEVEYFKTSRLRLQTQVPLDVYADGEYVCRTPVEVAVVPRALQVIVL